VYPIGVTLNNALAGAQVDVCTQGLVTAISATSKSSLQRGSVVGVSGNDGRVEAQTTFQGNYAILGSAAMGGPVVVNDPILIYLQPWYSVY
jgi:hypothetical protein